MKSKTEYKVTELKFWALSKPISVKMEEHLNMMSESGWELTNQISTLGLFEFPNYLRFTWVRKKQT
jgi:hypothetical protein